MKAPEKVYIDDFGSGFSHGWHTEHSYEKDIEYIRKEAFIEKACEWIKENLLKHTYVYEGEVGIGMAVFLEEFKQAMKVE